MWNYLNKKTVVEHRHMGCLQLWMTLLDKPEKDKVDGVLMTVLLPVNYQTKVDQLLMISTNSLTAFGQPGEESCTGLFR